MPTMPYGNLVAYVMLLHAPFGDAQKPRSIPFVYGPRGTGNGLGPSSPRARLTFSEARYWNE